MKKVNQTNVIENNEITKMEVEKLKKSIKYKKCLFL